VRITRWDFEPGEAYRRDAGVAHNVINGGTQPMAFVEIEYK
jgi:beta-alanine degradation protein BauB